MASMYIHQMVRDNKSKGFIVEYLMSYIDLHTVTGELYDAVKMYAEKIKRIRVLTNDNLSGDCYLDMDRVDDIWQMVDDDHSKEFIITYSMKKKDLYTATCDLYYTVRVCERLDTKICEFEAMPQKNQRPGTTKTFS